ncbi:MAG: acyl-CoA thioesterase [Lachnospiraceae bacterium]|mgnify:CR=1 FL=1|nr:acyl-CoA thioesterase [Lachnospiraceae bacterium]
MEIAKRVQESLTEQVHLVMNGDINGHDRLFGGKLMQWIDEVAVITARRHASHTVTTAAVENLTFQEGAYMGELVVLVGRLVSVGRSSMKVRVDVYKEQKNGERHSINEAFLTLVALDKNDNPVEVPRLLSD